MKLFGETESIKLTLEQAKALFKLIEENSQLMELSFSELNDFYEKGLLNSSDKKLMADLERLRPVWEHMYCNGEPLKRNIANEHEASEKLRSSYNYSDDYILRVSKFLKSFRRYELSKGAISAYMKILKNVSTFASNDQYIKAAVSSQLFELAYKRKPNHLILFHVLKEHEDLKMETPVWIDKCLRELSSSIFSENGDTLSSMTSKSNRKNFETLLKEIEVSAAYKQNEISYIAEHDEQPKREYLVAQTAEQFNLSITGSRLREILRKQLPDRETISVKRITSQYRSGKITLID